MSEANDPFGNIRKLTILGGAGILLVACQLDGSTFGVLRQLDRTAVTRG